MISHSDFLFRVCCDEVQRRESKKLEQRLRRAISRPRSAWRTSSGPSIRKSKAKLVDLAACHFVEKQENVLLIGPTGVGKSHLAQAIGERACRGGHSVAYTSAHRMLSTLRGARADQSYDKKLLRYTTPEWTGCCTTLTSWSWKDTPYRNPPGARKAS
ncbi:MAG: ATP-binding protein [Planctomycetes bacterium]|nr:ATP-binding protein [Planctomycetota bacterium]